ncbi:hypothetical protein CB1_000621003 [Camelus ferus]|nr:hypothetical protein CB1_000621003 [Camelus ferus]
MSFEPLLCPEMLQHACGQGWRARDQMSQRFCPQVLKEICVGELNPNETVQASLEAQLLSKLDHPTIVKFHASFVEQDNFCIITEYCEFHLSVCAWAFPFRRSSLLAPHLQSHLSSQAQLKHLLFCKTP